jgi:hypothetical protein
LLVPVPGQATMVGQRGVGKTALLAPQLRIALLRLSKLAHAKDLAVRALRALAGFAKGLKVSYADIEVGLDYEGEAGLADNGDLEHDLHDLQELLESAGAAAKAAGTALVIFVDELQYVPAAQLAALITDPLLSVLPPRMGPAQLASRRRIADRRRRRGSCDHDGRGRPRRELLPRSLRSTDAAGKALPARHGRTRPRAPSIRGDRRMPQA